MMADYSQQIDDLKAAEEICQRHVITETVNGVQSSYPRWPNAFSSCEKVHQWWLETETMKNSGDEEDRQAVMRESARLR
jgi:hypothetical protein